MDITPPPIIGSVLQSTGTQRQQSRVQDADANRRAAAARELAQLEQQQVDSVENTDSDSRVHPDTGGQGSRGRSYDEQPSEFKDAEADDADDTPGDGRLDLTA